MSAGTAIAIHRPESSAAVEVGEPSWAAPEKLELLKRTFAAGTSDDDFALFVEVAKATGLSPLQRQVYAIMRETWNPATKRREPKMTIQTGIDGYRLIAARTGRHAGTTDAEYGPDATRGTFTHPTWARVTVLKLLPNGQTAEFTATARWSEYAQTNREGDPTGQWGKMPYLMLGKCAEALALRKAFPAELSGVYTAEEMSQADSIPALQPGERVTKRELADRVAVRAADALPTPASDTGDTLMPAGAFKGQPLRLVPLDTLREALAWYARNQDAKVDPAVLIDMDNVAQWKQAAADEASALASGREPGADDDATGDPDLGIVEEARPVARQNAQLA